MVKLLTFFFFYFFLFKEVFNSLLPKSNYTQTKDAINTKPNQYSFHSSIQIIKAIDKHLGQADSVNINSQSPTHGPPYHLSALFKDFFCALQQ